ncbi:hypothetical protein IJ596_04310 [bacterium]|nr:hypothetical protein [bacterium]
MLNNFESFDNSETATKKDIVIQERVELISSHMYKQFLDYQNSTINTNDIFSRMIDCLNIVSDNLKQSFSSRGITTQNIYVESDTLKSIAVVNILWHKMSFTTRCNFQPQSLFRDDGRHISANRIMAIRGNYNDLMQDAKDKEEEMTRLLENEIASLYIPPDQTQKCIFKIKHSGQEFALNQIDAPRDVVLKVVETVCGGGLYHQDGSVKTFTV